MHTDADRGDDLVRVYRQMYPTLVRTAYLLVDTREQAEEVVQEAFAKAFPKWDRLDVPEAYLRTCVVNGCRRIHRRRRLVSRTPQYAAPDAAGDTLDHVADVVRRLPSPQREAVVLRYYLQATDQEIAATLEDGRRHREVDVAPCSRPVEGGVVVNEFDREIEAALRRRAESVQSHPLGFGDVEPADHASAPAHRVAGHRCGGAAGARRPRLGGHSTRAGRPGGRRTGTRRSAHPPATGGADPVALRKPGAADDDCARRRVELLRVLRGPRRHRDDGGTVMPMPTTTVSAIDLTTLLDQVLFVDASGDLDMGMTLIGQLGAPPRYLVPATRTVEQTMAMPTGADVSVAYEISGRLGIGGFDTWTPDLIDGELPDGIAVVIVIGQDWFDRSMASAQTTVACSTGFADETTTTWIDTATGSGATDHDDVPDHDALPC